MSTLDSNYAEVLDSIIKYGDLIPIKSNLGPVETTKELSNCITRWSMADPINGTVIRNLNYRFMFAEAYWILRGDDTADGIVPYCKPICKFLDDDNPNQFFGAYGPKVVGQMPYVIKTLSNDQQSRRAVLTIWRENPRPSRDIPCTISMQFMIRKGRLNTTVYMRSSDAWLGLPYDVFNFSMISAVVCILLHESGISLSLGALTIHAGSLHLYEKNLVKANKIALSKENLDTIKFHGLILAEFNYAAEFVKFLRDRRDENPTEQVSLSQDYGRN
jgi:thymidylate synthase